MSFPDDPNQPAPGGGFTPPPPPGGAVPPPPGGGFNPPPSPQGGGFPPPTPGQFGAPSGGYQVYGQTPIGGDGTIDVGSMFSWAIAKFSSNVATLVPMAAIIAVVGFVGQFISTKIAEGARDRVVTNANGTVSIESGSGVFTQILLAIAVGIVIAIITAYLRIGLLRAALKLTNGQAPALSDLASGPHTGAYIATAVVTGICVAIGIVLCVIPGLVAAFLLIFAPVHSLATGQGVGEAFSTSADVAKRNVLPILLIVLVSVGIAAVMGLIGGIFGAVVITILSLGLEPLSALLTANGYKQGTRQPIAA